MSERSQGDGRESEGEGIARDDCIVSLRCKGLGRTYPTLTLSNHPPNPNAVTMLLRNHPILTTTATAVIWVSYLLAGLRQLQQTCKHRFGGYGDHFVIVDAKFVIFDYKPSNKLIENSYFFF